MSITLTRREVLQFVGGAALGALFSPIPWKVLDDTAEWTQNWPWIPKAPTGNVSYMGATCTLCQSACGMRARTIGRQPISLAGITGHPFNNGALCTMGILAHHLRYHPQRLKQPVKYAPGSAHAAQLSSTNALDEISRHIASSAAAGSVAVIDSRPGRTASSLLRSICSSHEAMRYIPVSAPSLDVLHAMMPSAPLAPLGCDIDGASLILNFGAPLFDNWGTPSRAAALLDRRGAKDQTIIHVEGICSRSAERSSEWIAARPGSEALLALGIANVIIGEKLCSPAAARTITDFARFADFVAAFTPDAVSKAAGVTPETIKSTARAFASHRSAVAIIGSDASLDARSAVMALNVLTGAIGRTGGIALRSDIPGTAALSAHTAFVAAISSVPDHSLRVIILDESLSGCTLPDALLEKKLVSQDSIIVSLSPFVTPRPFCTQSVLPASVMFETLTDVPGPIDRPASSLALATAALPAPEGTMDAVQFALALGTAIGSPAAAAGTTEELIKQRIAALHASKRGSLFAPSTGAATAMKSVASADDVWSALTDGGCWIDDVPHGLDASAKFSLMPLFSGTPISLPKPREVDQLVVLPFAEMKVYDGTAISPLLSKVSQESDLRPGLHQAYVNPATAGGFAVATGDTISLTTEHGTMKVHARVDVSVMPGVIFVSTAHGSGAGGSVQQTSDIRMLCDMNGSGSFNPTPVSIQKVLA
jgi:hypothetical protein